MDAGESYIELSRAIESVCPAFGCHVALTGGCLYKQEPRKDADFIIYRIRQVKEINMAGLWGALAKLGIEVKSGRDWCFKAIWRGHAIDFLFPESAGGTYRGQDAEALT